MDPHLRPGTIAASSNRNDLPATPYLVQINTSKPMTYESWLCITLAADALLDPPISVQTNPFTSCFLFAGGIKRW